MKLKRRVEKLVNDGWTDWLPTVEGRHRVACCECGLVHDFEFDVVEGEVTFRAKRNKRATAQFRRRSGAPA